jgi:tubulin alpha
MYVPDMKFEQEVVEAIWMEVEKTQGIDAVVIFAAMAGGTGGGYSARIWNKVGWKVGLEKIIWVGVVPDWIGSRSCVEDYNFVLSFGNCIEKVEMFVLYDNYTLTKIWEEQLGIDDPTYDDINQLFAQSLVSILSSTYIQANDGDKFGHIKNKTLKWFIQDLVPDDKKKWWLPSFSPFISSNATNKELNAKKDNNSKKQILKLVSSVVDPSNYMAFYSKGLNSNHKEITYGMKMDFRGKVTHSDIVQIYPKILENLEFTDLYSGSVTQNVISHDCFDIDTFSGGSLGQATDISISLLHNTSQIAENFKIFGSKFDKVYKSRAYVQMFCEYGLEESENFNNRYDLERLQTEYEFESTNENNADK